MAVVSDQTIAKAALAGGFPRDKAAMAVSVALAESGGDATETNSNTNGTTDYGLWQINSIHKADLAAGDWRDPIANARMAAAVFKRSNNTFTPWYAWRDGKHLPFMGRATIAVIQAGAGTAAPGGDGKDNPWVPDWIEEPYDDGKQATDDAAGAWAEIKKAFGTMTDKDTWIRGGMMLLGGLILIAAVVALFVAMGSKTTKFKEAGKVAKQVAGSGKSRGRSTSSASTATGGTSDTATQ